jgi:glycosyltransferase involved in cell wall biosynthesis
MHKTRGQKYAKTVQRTHSQPGVSVVIPAHNEERWIAACLESVLRIDSYANKEVIVVDDASTDGTSEILNRFPITVIRNEKTIGPSSTRNIGVREARGEIIVFIDAHCIVDDPEWIDKFLQFFREPKIGAVGGYFRSEPNKKGPSLALRPAKARLRLIKSANAAYRKVVLEQVGGFDPSMEWGGDAALTYKIHRSGWKVAHTRDIMVVHAERIWPMRKVFLYGTCHFPLRERYPHETKVRGVLVSPMEIGILLTVGIVADLICRFPIFTMLFVVLVSVLNGASARDSISRILIDGFYTTTWCLSYYLGALYGGVRMALSSLMRSLRKRSRNESRSLWTTSHVRSTL